MTTLKILRPIQGRLVFVGAVTGTRYEWQPKDGQFITVDDGDVPALLAMTYTQGCGCGRGDEVKKLPTFEVTSS